jgi:hypothetical protein
VIAGLGANSKMPVGGETSEEEGIFFAPREFGI